MCITLTCRYPRAFYQKVYALAANLTAGLDAKALQWFAAPAFAAPGWRGDAAAMAAWYAAADEAYAHVRGCPVAEALPQAAVAGH
eukprot:298286-Chlamydomonas_euryale.AAC.5